MTDRTLFELSDRFGLEMLDHLDRQVRVPVLTGLQFQGDVAVVPRTPPGSADEGEAMPVLPREGQDVVRPQRPGGHTHRVVPDGDGVQFTPVHHGEPLVVAFLRVPPGSTAYLLHPEHGASGIGPGSYEFRRQQESRPQPEPQRQRLRVAPTNRGTAFVED